MTRLGHLVALALAASACSNSSSGKSAGSSGGATPAPSASASDLWIDTPPIGVPLSAAEVGRVVNPNRDRKYSGPTGTVRGVVHIEGDPPPDQPYRFPPGCGEAAAAYSKLFRVGAEKAAADVLVAINFDKHYVPATEPVQTVTIKGCAFSTRTLAVTFGQRVEVVNKDSGSDPYMPYLDGAKAKAVLVTVPGGDPVKLYPLEPKAHYLLRDELPRPFLNADVFVLAFATHAVTGLDGRYEIKNVPVGKATVNAYLPAIDATVTKTIEVVAGDNTSDLTLVYKAPAPAGSASARPSASAPVAPKPPKKP